MIYARSVLLALEGARSFFRSSSARLENHFLWYRSRSARLENFFARLARARKIYARTQHYITTIGSNCKNCCPKKADMISLKNLSYMKWSNFTS